LRCPARGHEARPQQGLGAAAQLHVAASEDPGRDTDGAFALQEPQNLVELVGPEIGEVEKGRPSGPVVVGDDVGYGDQTVQGSEESGSMP
jgi:hypothetical protein